MAIIREQSGNTRNYVTDFIVDKKAEVADLPVFPQVAKGSSCLAIEDSSFYILGEDNTWKSLL